MHQHLREVAVELFAAYDVEIARCPAPSEEGLGHDTYCVASIEYVGQGLKGVLALAATRAAAEAWTSVAGGMECDVYDTVGEFSNMLLGRLKGRLLREGIPISLATPTTLSRNQLGRSVPARAASWQLYEGPGWQLGTRLDAAFGPEFQRESSPTEPVAAGEALLF